MKFLIALLLLFSAVSQAQSTNLELVGGSLTFHIIPTDAASAFPNKLDSDGRLVYTPLVGVRLIHFTDSLPYYSATVFEGRNCINSPIHGALFSTGLDLGDVNLGIVGGGYIQNYNDYRAAGVEDTLSIGQGTNSFAPVIGFEVNIRKEISEGYYWGINNLLTPVLTNHSLFIGAEL